MVVGQAPGNHEFKSKGAFAGPSGRRLNEWLVSCGMPAANPRQGLYLTSVVKCVPPNNRCLARMVRNCRGFLDHQIALIKPSLIITLGRLAYEELRIEEVSYDDALCHTFETKGHLLVSAFGFDYTLLAWPHPSGLNRWHNEPENRSALEASFLIVKHHLNLTHEE
jgi:uracil-DNA glycosylase family 4